MAPIPFAFSVHHFVSSVGADAGFAAIIGLAILVLLYFAQARETASLRRNAEDSAEQVQQLELRVAQLSRGALGSGTMPPAPAPAPPGIARPAAAPAPAIAAARTGTAAPVAARTAALTGIPAAPAGVGAPALSSATRLIPISEADPATSNGGSSEAAVQSPSGPPPATAAGGATATNGRSNSGSGTGVTMPPPKTAPRTAARPAARPTSGRSTAPPRRPGGGSGGRGGGSRTSRVTRGFIILMSLLGIVAVVVVLLIVTSGGGSSAQSSSTAAQSAKAGGSRRAHSRRAAAVTPASVTVAVLNGTSIANLAHDVGQRLGTAGFKQGDIATAADQTQTATVIGYLPGHKAAALLVAKSLKLGSASVQPVDQSNRTVACPASSTPCTAKVVVTVGSDLASTQTQ